MAENPRPASGPVYSVEQKLQQLRNEHQGLENASRAMRERIDKLEALVEELQTKFASLPNVQTVTTAAAATGAEKK